MAAYYNEWEPYPAQWLRNLISAGLIAPGEVDTRSITDVKAEDLKGFTQCHFFAGIGGWSAALRLSLWPDARPVWTASLPCPSFSVANVAHGGAKGQRDARHLLPDFLALASECRPSVIFGEQVKNAIKWGWLDELFCGLEAHSYACGASVMQAFCAKADHERERIFWVADAGRERRKGHKQIERLSIAEKKALTFYGNPLARARRPLEGDYGGLLLGNGLSVAVERCATRGYGNAIVPQVAAEFITAFMEERP